MSAGTQPRHWRFRFGQWHHKQPIPLGQALPLARYWAAYARHRYHTTLWLARQARQGWDASTRALRERIMQEALGDYQHALRMLDRVEQKEQVG
jgi:hypothetical protein